MSARAYAKAREDERRARLDPAELSRLNFPRPMLMANENRYPGRCFDCQSEVPAKAGSLGRVRFNHEPSSKTKIFCDTCATTRVKRGLCL